MKRALCILPLLLLTSCGTAAPTNTNEAVDTSTLSSNTNSSGDLFGLLETNSNGNTNSINGNTNDQGLFTGTMEERKAMEEKLKSALSLKQEVMGMNPSGDKQAIADKITQIKALTAELKNSDAFFIDADTIDQDLMSLENRMANTVQASSLPVLLDVTSKFPKAVLQSLTKRGDGLFGITEGGVVGPLDGPQDAIKAHAFPEGTMGSRGTYSLKFRELYISSIPGGIFKYSEQGLVPQKVEGGAWYPARALEAYGKSIYILDALQGKLLRYDQKSEGIFTKGVAALDHPELLNGKITSFAIDGNIYVLLEGGKLFKFIKGEKKDLTIDIDLSKASSRTEISTNVNSGNLYIFDPLGKKLYKMKKLLSGLSLAKEYGLPQEFTGFQVSSNEKKAYFTTSTQVFTLDL